MTEKKAVLPKLDPQSLPGPETILREELDNGIMILSRENFASPSVVISGFLVSGSILESPDQAGLADLTVASLMMGTRNQDFQAIYERIESIGASLSIGAAKHSSPFFSKGLAEDLDVLLDTLNDVLRNPIFPISQVERLKAEKLTSLAIRDQSTSARAHLAFNELTYPGHPYSVPTEGSMETVSGLQVEDLQKFHRNNIGPKGMVISVVGAVRSKDAVSAVKEVFADWANPNQPSPKEISPANQPKGVKRVRVDLEGKVQNDIVLGAPGPSRYDPDYLAAAIGNSILGRFGMYGRLGDRVRKSAGLAYYAYSSVLGGQGPGAWQFVVGVNPVNVEQAIDLIRDEIRKFVTKPVTNQELSDNQANFIGRLPLQLESNEGVSGAIIHTERYSLGLDYYQRYPSLITSITRDQILQTAKRFLDPDKLVIAIAGPGEVTNET
ncbi:MAG: insulinase family protein [Anaerolineales bacterium]|nr:insulinase family protein [Anaerolineales bacterium]